MRWFCPIFCRCEVRMELFTSSVTAQPHTFPQGKAKEPLLQPGSRRREGWSSEFFASFLRKSGIRGGV